MVPKTEKEARPKRTKRKAGTAAEPSSWPTADSLALIAANVSRGIDLEPCLAVDYALRLWKNAREKLEGEMKEPTPVEPAPVPDSNQKSAKSDEISQPPAFPAALDTFLRLVVNGQTLADSTNRFREFLRNTSATESEADKRLANYAAEGFRDSGSWRVTALEYRDWWESREAQSAGRPAESPVAPTPAKTMLPTLETFLRTVVKGETDADSEKRFCAFLRSKFPEPEADAWMARLHQEGFKDLVAWLATAREYRDWCKSEKPN